MLKKFHGSKKTNHFLHKASIIKSNRGQLAIEAVLLMSLVLGFFIYFTNRIKSQKSVQKIFSTPVTNLKNMTTYGTWKQECAGLGSSKQAQKLANCHPNSISRALSSDPK